MSRLEHDFLGELTIDDSVYYGVQTLRAMNNFHISGTPLSQFPEMIWALACVKKACALANMELQVLPRDIGIAICAACDRILAGNMLDQFPVDCIQGGAGTSTNMNANEVIANLALEIMGHPRGPTSIAIPTIMSTARSRPTMSILRPCGWPCSGCWITLWSIWSLCKRALRPRAWNSPISSRWGARSSRMLYP